MSGRTAPRVPRVIRSNTFLDDPAEYPEFSELTSKLPRTHALRLAFHHHRTGALLLVVAVCMALSGVPSPSRGATSAAWVAYCKAAVGVDRLVAHFEGFPTAFVILVVIAALSILAYPLHTITSRGGPRPENSIAAVGAFAITAGLPCTALWGVAIWAKSHFAWGVASGMWVGLFCACSTLKVTSFAAECAPAPPTPEKKASAGEQTPAPAPACNLRFREFLFFLFGSPSLVCDVRLMKTAVRRSSRPSRAASEFFHAVLAFLAAHCLVGNVVAPALRVIVAGLMPGWAAGAAWSELDAAGGGGWPSWETASGLLAGGMRPWVTLACLLWILTAMSALLNFLGFYGFWHCVCLGMAELWGFPDRHLYGCWWLAYDEPREFIRMWSVPVHRWLASRVHWPMLKSAAAAASRKVDAAENGSGVQHESGAEKLNGQSPPGRVRALMATFFVSAFFHEAVMFVGMRGTCWPFNTFLVSVAAILVTFWDSVYPLEEEDQQPQVLAPSAEKKGATGVIRAYGRRGLASAAAFSLLAQMSITIADVVAWLWWRHIFLK